jgi:hypothetical protein
MISLWYTFGNMLSQRDKEILDKINKILITILAFILLILIYLLFC